MCEDIGLQLVIDESEESNYKSVYGMFTVPQRYVYLTSYVVFGHIRVSICLRDLG
jgi:hypothetical protein